MKYIIEIAKEYEEYFKGILICGIAEGKFAVDVIAKEDLEELNSDYINEHFSDLQDTAYQKGFEDGKAVNDKGCEGCKYANVAGTHEPCVRCSNSYGNQWTAKDDKIEVGDEVCNIDPDRNDTGIVTWRRYDDIYIMYSDGSAGRTQVKYYRKTGRHFDIDKILDEMKGNNDK